MSKKTFKRKCKYKNKKIIKIKYKLDDEFSINFYLYFIAPIVFILFIAWLMLFFTNPLPSYFYINSNVAKIGIIPSVDFDEYLSFHPTQTIHLAESPFIYKSKIYLPLVAVAKASGIPRENIIKRDNKLIIHGDIQIDLKEKEVVLDDKIINLNSSLLVKNKEIFLSTKYIPKIFKMNVNINQNEVILSRGFLFSIFSSNLLE